MATLLVTLLYIVALLLLFKILLLRAQTYLMLFNRSTSGYCVFHGDNLLSWSAKRHVTLSCSSAEAYYLGVANVVAETTWIIECVHQHMKHIEIDIHFVRNFVALRQVRVLHLSSAALAVLTTRHACHSSLDLCLSSRGESLLYVSDAYYQSLKALPSQPAASGSESHVPGVVSE
ncbi:ribonuclease H-like domain-containing protein [Tanacetum coccineum]|uniref:Ribonuclease H-like domain-containing protein n=1 Tax=Tanacetum coccineum TaxID=301880 RepID=A0ABQ4WNN4_9ASTR